MNSSGIRSAFMMIHYEYKHQYNNKR